jgi:hypothetical protein
VDIDYFTRLHDLHVELLLAPKYYDSRLCTTLFNKNQYPYLVHSQILQYYIRNEGSKFQKCIPCGYLIKVLFLNRTSTKNINVKNKNNKALFDMYKLLNNSLYDKTLKKCL